MGTKRIAWILGLVLLLFFIGIAIGVKSVRCEEINTSGVSVPEIVVTVDQGQVAQLSAGAIETSEGCNFPNDETDRANETGRRAVETPPNPPGFTVVVETPPQIGESQKGEK